MKSNPNGDPNPNPNPNPNHYPKQLLVQPCSIWVEFPTYAVLSTIKWKTYFYLFAIKPGYCQLKLTK